MNNMDKLLASRLMNFQAEQALSGLNSGSSHSEEVISHDSAPVRNMDDEQYALSLRSYNSAEGQEFLIPFEDTLNENRTQHLSKQKFSSRPIETEHPAMLAELNIPVGIVDEDYVGSISGPGVLDGRWASSLLLGCAKAISVKEMGRVQQLLWILNELASPYGDCEQRLASYFLQALFCKITETGPRCYRTLCTAVDRMYSFHSMRKMMLKFQEASPWTTFGHVAANGAILEAFDGESNLHIVDISNTLCTQWPTLLEALATRNDGTPNLRLTTVIVSSGEAAGNSAMKVMKEVGQRMEKFARLMGVPFEFAALQQEPNDHLDLGRIELRTDEALAINCIHSLQRIPGRDSMLASFRSMNPKIVTVVEDEADLSPDDFFVRFRECHRFFSLYFESLEESFGRTSNERLMVERGIGRSMINILACNEAPENCERRQKGVQWGLKLKAAGFEPRTFSDDVVDDVRALLKRYKDGWGTLSSDSEGLFLTWREQCALWASAWKPNQ